MEKYKIELANKVYLSLSSIYEHKKEYDLNSAINFANGFFNEVQKLSYFPNRGLNKPWNKKVIFYKKHLIIYHVWNWSKTVIVLDIIDPRQDSVANIYY